jgi:hypothetical protein
MCILEIVVGSFNQGPQIAQILTKWHFCKIIIIIIIIIIRGQVLLDQS